MSVCATLCWAPHRERSSRLQACRRSVALCPAEAERPRLRQGAEQIGEWPRGARDALNDVPAAEPERVGAAGLLPVENMAPVND